MLQDIKIQKPYYTDSIVKYNATLDDTLSLIAKISTRDKHQVFDLAQKLKGDTVKQTAYNIWLFVKENIPYKEDKRGTEQVRTPARVIEDAKNGIGSDCDCFTTFISAILKNLNIDHYYKVVAWKGEEYAHIYPVAIDENGNEYAIDGIPQILEFNVELPYTAELIFNKNYNMDLQELNGTMQEIETKAMEDEFFASELNGYNPDEDSEDSLDRYYIENYQALMGNTIVVDDEKEADIILTGGEFFEGVFYKQVQLLLSNLKKEQANPTFLSKRQNTKKEIAIAETILEEWSSKDLPSILSEAIQDSDMYKTFYTELRKGITEYTRPKTLNGIDDFDIYLQLIDDEELNGLILNGTLDGWFSKAWNKVKTGFKKAGKKISTGLKKVGRALHRGAMFPMRATLFPILRAGGGVLFLARYASPEDLKKSAKLREKKRRADLIVNKLVKALGYTTSGFDKLVKAGIKTAFGGVDKAFARLKRGKQLYGQSELNGELGWVAAVAGVVVKLWQFIKKIFKKKPQDPKLSADDFAQENSAPTPNYDNNTDTYETYSNNNSDNNPIQRGTMMSKSGKPSNQNLDTNNDGKVSTGEKVKGFFKKHKTKIIIISIVIVLLIVGFVFWKKSQHKPKRKTRALNGTRVITSTSVKTIDTGKRLKKMHRIAKQLKKQYPNAKYSTLLKKASAQMRK